MNINWRNYIIILSGYIFFELLSFIAYTNPIIRGPVYAAVIIAVLVISWRRPMWALGAVFFELLVGGKGYLLSWPIGGDTVPIRMGLYAVLMIVAVRKYWLENKLKKIRWPCWMWWVGSLLAWVIAMTVWGLIQGYPLSRVYTDMNAFLFLAVLPAAWIIGRGGEWRKYFVTLMAAAVTLVGLKSWLIVAIFTHDHTWLMTVYRWIRNTGIGEIMPMNDHLYRVFFQSQIIGLLAVWIFLEMWRTGRKQSWWLLVPAVTAMMAVMISLSRSFWVAAGVGGVVYIIITGRQWRSWIKLWPAVLALGIAWLGYSWAVNYPNPLPSWGKPNATSAVTARIHTSGTTDAATARKNQIGPLWSEIKKNPVIGRGFGATATYYSTDPRSRGWRTTSAFELAYLDWWLKMGIIGLALLAGWIWVIVRPLWKWKIYWTLASLAALLTVHMFTPYLNHPIGLGWLILLTIYSTGD